jgi:REP element-mobilizing transposase RayT
MDASLRANQWTIELRGVVVMPDHVHMIFTPLVDIEKSEVFSLARITKAIKGTSAHLINLVEPDGFGKKSPLTECCGFRRSSTRRLLTFWITQ